MRVLAPHEAFIYKEVIISGDNNHSFTAMLPYLKRYDEALLGKPTKLLNDRIVFNDEFDDALINSIQIVFPGAVLASQIIVYDNAVDKLIQFMENPPITVRKFDIIVRSNMEGIEPSAGVKADDFYTSLKLRVKLPPESEKLQYIATNHSVYLPYANVKNHLGKIIPV